MRLALSGPTVIGPAPLFAGVTVRTGLTCVLSPPVPIVLSLTQRLVLHQTTYVAIVADFYKPSIIGS
jgi:hypothetical protein